MQLLPEDIPVVPHADGKGFNILLKKTATASTLTPPPAPAMAPSGIGSDYARSPEQPQGAWVDDLMQTLGTGNSRAQYEQPVPPPDMGGALPESGGPLSRMLPAGWGDTAAAAVGGLNTIERNQSPLAAFGAGMAGAMDVREGRRKDKRAEMLEMEDRQLRKDELKYQHGRDEFRDQFLMTEEERRQAAEERAARGEKWDELTSAQQAEINTLKLKESKITLDRLANQHGIGAKEAADLYTSVVASAGKQFEGQDMTDEKNADAYRKVIEDNYREGLAKIAEASGSSAAAPAEAPTGPDGLPVATAPVNPAAAGVSAATAISWPRGAAPKSEAEFHTQMEKAVAANNGNPVYYRNPANPTGPPLLYLPRAR